MNDHESLLARAQNRVKCGWLILALLILFLGFLSELGPLPLRLFLVVTLEVGTAAWFLLILYTQRRASDTGSKGESFRGPMPTWRAVFWTCLATAGTFACMYGLSKQPLISACVCAAVTAVFFGGLTFMVNWLAGEDGRAWARKYAGQLGMVYTAVTAISLILKLLDVFFHKR